MPSEKNLSHRIWAYLKVDLLREIWKKHKPFILFSQKFMLYFGYNKLYTVEPRRCSGGQVLFYNDEIKLEIYESNIIIDVKTLFGNTFDCIFDKVCELVYSVSIRHIVDKFRILGEQLTDCAYI